MSRAFSLGVAALLSEQDTKAMRKREALWARLGMYRGEDLEKLLTAALPSIDPLERTDYSLKVAHLLMSMERAHEDLSGAQDGFRGAEARGATNGRLSDVYQWLVTCRASVRKLEQQVAELREELEPYAMRAGAKLSAMWPEEEP